MTASPEIPAERVPGIPNDVLSGAEAVAMAALGRGLNTTGLLIARAILAERQRCVEVVKSAPHFIPHTDEEFAETGLMGRQTGRADLIDAIQGHAA